MIKSMTGYGRCFVDLEGKKFIVEIKTLNSKLSDINLKLPKDYISKDIAIRNQIAAVLERGKIDCLVSVEVSPDKAVIPLNQSLFSSYYNQTLWLQNEAQLERAEHIKYLLANPDISKVATKEPEEQEFQAIFNALEATLTQVDDFRINEGQILEEDLAKRVSNIATLLSEIEPFESERVARIKDKIYSQLKEFEIENTDQNRLEQELIYYIEKLDFTEEKVRLDKHIKYFLETMSDSQSQGKKLGFIAQEIGREINTLGSKANDAQIQQIVVRMKDELEKIKEQLFNIL
jgi:uncharacterized protein (TIGR00255 family)